jgi:hypothetical protein
MINLITALTAYSYQEKKPFLKIKPEHFDLFVDQPENKNPSILV